MIFQKQNGIKASPKEQERNGIRKEGRKGNGIRWVTEAGYGGGGLAGSVNMGGEWKQDKGVVD